MDYIFIPALASFGVAFLLTPLIGRIATKFKFVTESNHRTMHSSPIPFLGGISIYAGVFCSLLSFAFVSGFHLPYNHYVFGYFLGSTIIFAIGLYDDINGASCYEKLLLQLVASLVIIMFDVNIRFFTTIFGMSNETYLADAMLTIFWIVGITNAFNLIDGLDGLAGGITIISLLAFPLFMGADFDSVAVVLIAALIGANAGFLKYNFNPAKIFMGDAGSLFIGYSVAIISIKVFFQQPMTIGFSLPFLILGFPIVDTLIAIYRRLNRHIHPFEADSDHIHHRLIRLGLSHRKAVFALYAISLLFILISVIVSAIGLKYALIIFLCYGLFCYGAVRFLGYFKKAKNA